MFIIVKSNPELHSVLTELVVASKRSWNYSEKWMQLWKEDLIISKKYLLENDSYHLEEEGEIIGFYSFSESEDGVVLDNMFVHARRKFSGLGTVLMNDFLEKMKRKKVHKIVLYADPNAEKFYKKFGFVTIDKKHTTIEERFLPIMEKVIP